MTYTQAQIDQANQVDLAEFLRSHGEELIRSGSEYRWKRHDSLTIKGSKWFRHSQSAGGYPVDFVMEFWNKPFPEAVEMLIGEKGEGRAQPVPAPTPAFVLPAPHTDMKQVADYLIGTRKLSAETISTFAALGMIYEDAKHHNVVFVGRDYDDVPCYASMRSTESNFRQDVPGSEKAYGFRFDGASDRLFVFESPIDLLSFIDLYPKEWESRTYVSLGGVSDKALQYVLSHRPDIQRIYLCLDKDEAGEAACKRIADSLTDTYSVIRYVPALKDWNEVLQHREDIPKPLLNAFVLREPHTEEPVSMIRMSDITETQVEWLWYPYIPFGKLTILQGNPGEGKTYFAMQLAAACTNRRELPDTEPFDPFNVIYQTAEDGLGDTVKPRLLEAGADLDRVLVIDDSDKQLTLSDDRIEKAIRQNHARLLIIDPVQAFLGAEIDMNRANEVRPVFRKLGDIAQSTGCAIMLIGHLNKASGAQSTYRGLGSIDLTAAVRSLLLIGKVKSDPTTRVLTHDKSSLAPPGKSLAFSLGDENGFEWIGEYRITADELLSGSEHTETKLEQAERLILTMLESRGTCASSDIDKAAQGLGISPRTVRTAKQHLSDRLRSERIGTQWMLSLRPSEPANDLINWQDSIAP